MWDKAEKTQERWTVFFFLLDHTHTLLYAAWLQDIFCVSVGRSLVLSLVSMSIKRGLSVCLFALFGALSPHWFMFSPSSAVAVFSQHFFPFQICPAVVLLDISTKIGKQYYSTAVNFHLVPEWDCENDQQPFLKVALLFPHSSLRTSFSFEVGDSKCRKWDFPNIWKGCAVRLEHCTTFNSKCIFAGLWMHSLERVMCECECLCCDTGKWFLT